MFIYNLLIAKNLKTVVWPPTNNTEHDLNKNKTYECESGSLLKSDEILPKSKNVKNIVWPPTKSLEEESDKIKILPERKIVREAKAIESLNIKNNVISDQINSDISRACASEEQSSKDNLEDICKPSPKSSYVELAKTHSEAIATTETSVASTKQSTVSSVQSVTSSEQTVVSAEQFVTSSHKSAHSAVSANKEIKICSVSSSSSNKFQDTYSEVKSVSETEAVATSSMQSLTFYKSNSQQPVTTDSISSNVIQNTEKTYVQDILDCQLESKIQTISSHEAKSKEESSEMKRSSETLNITDDSSNSKTVNNNLLMTVPNLLTTSDSIHCTDENNSNVQSIDEREKETTEINFDKPLTKPLPPTLISNSVPRCFYGHVENSVSSTTNIRFSESQPETVHSHSITLNQGDSINKLEKNIDPGVQSSPLSVQSSNRGITPIPPIKKYNPPEKKESPIPMPPETKPYIPPDFKITIEPKVTREKTSSPFVEALTITPDRPFTPINIHNIERGSFVDALTVAPDRPYSPLSINNINQSSSQNSSSVITQSTVSEIVRPIATQNSAHINDKVVSETSTMLNTCKLQSSSETSAFRPISKQNVQPSQSEQLYNNFPPVNVELKSNFEKSSRSNQTMTTTESVCHSSVTSMNTQSYSTVKNVQNYFEKLDQKETLSSTAVRTKSGLHKPDSIPPYQKNFEQLLSQRGITPEISNAPAILQRPVTPTTDPPVKSRCKSQEPPPAISSSCPTNQTSVSIDVKTTPRISHTIACKDTPISMTFQPVTDDNMVRYSPSRSRPVTPSLINKPAPIIPYYQMNLMTVEHSAPVSYLHEPSSHEGSRSPTPKPRSRSPAQGPPMNPLKAQAPRIKESTPQRHTPHSLLTQATSNLRREHEMGHKEFQSIEQHGSKSVNFEIQGQPLAIKEQIQSHHGFKNELYNKGNVTIKEESKMDQNYAERQIHSQNISKCGNTTVYSTKKQFEEYEHTRSEKFTEIRKGSTSHNSQERVKCDSSQSLSINPKQVFPPPIMSFPSSQQSSTHFTNKNVVDTSNKVETYQSNPTVSGANKGPVCDPTPPTSSSVGVPTRGKTFGVSSAPKRGRGVLNKAAVPGSRIPLCASCNGNIRGPFITALGRIWCPDHFICVNATCRRPLQDIGFVEENGQLYCEYCFEQYIAPACDKCHAKIKGDCLNAIGKHYHPECFNCVYCGKLFGNNPFFLEDGLPYCESDWNELFTTKCFSCGFPVEAGDRWVEALNNNYHSQCFNCTVCKKNLEGQSFFAKGGRPFCKTHAR